MEYTPQNMMQVGQLPLGMLWDGMDFLKQAQGRDAQTLAETMAENKRKQEMHGATLESTMAQTEGVRSRTRGTNLANDETAALQPAKIKHEFLRMAVEADENEWKNAVTRINQGMMDEDEGVRAYATNLYEMLPSVMEERRKAAAKAAEKQGDWDSAARVATIGAQSREAVASTKAASGGSADMNSILAKMKKASEKVAHLTAVIASLPADDPKAQTYTAMRDALIPQIAMENELNLLRAQGGWIKDANGDYAPATAPTLKPSAPGPAQVPPMFASNPKTGERITSTDGGKTWKPVK